MSSLPHFDDVESPNQADPFRCAVMETLRLAVGLCGAKYAVVRIDQDPPIATGDVVVLHQDSTDEVLIDSRGRIRGTLSVGGGRPSSHLDAIARQLTRTIELNDAAQSWKRELGRIQPLIDQAVVAIYSIQNGRFSYVNSKFADALGYSREELLALHSFDELIVEEERSRVRQMVRSRLDGEVRQVRYVTKIQAKDGRILNTEIHGSIAVVEGGRLVIGTATDVTAQVAAEEALREREEFFRVITEHIADIVLVVNGDGMISYISGSVENVLGYSVDERLGQRAFEKVHPDDAAALAAHFKRFAASERMERADFRFRHKNGSVRILELHGTNLLHHPQIGGWLINISDVTDRKRLEQELEQLSRLTSLGRLSAQVAHEFNNVMMGIQTPVDLIRRRTAGDPQMTRLTDMIASSIGRGKRITGDILRFGRPAQLALRSVEIQDFLREMSDEIRALLPQEIDFRLELPEAPLPVHADPAQLSQVLINLCLNARDAMQGRRGTLTIGARPGTEHTARSIGELPNSHEFVHVSVTDTGSGINPEDLPYIFEPLFTTKRTGTGLGLSVVYQVIAGHGGHIFVETQRGQGTTFHLFVRQALEEHRPEVVSDTEVEAVSLPKPRILIVEDEVAIATGLVWILEAEGMTAHVVGRAAEVMAAIESFNPDVMLLDLSLPDADGREVYERIEGRLPVIFSTGSIGELELLESGHEHVAVLMKPYTTEELLRTIFQVMAPGGESE
jgi:PAS domain S-box-containing protein